MGTYSLTNKSGQVITVDGPEGLSKKEVIGLAKRQQARAMDRARDAQVVTPGERFDDIFPGLGRGAVNLLEQSALGLASAFGEENELKARDFIQSAADSLRPDIEPGLEGSVQAALTEGLGSILPLIATGLAGPVAGPTLAGGMGITAGIGDASERARAAGATEEQRNASLLGGGVSGATQIVPVANMFRLASNLPKGVKARAINALESGSVEGAQEAIYEFLQNLNEREVYNPELESLYKNVAEAGGLGAGVGAIAQALVDFLPGKKWGIEPKVPTGDSENITSSLLAGPDDPDGPDGPPGAPPILEEALKAAEFSPLEEALKPTEFSPPPPARMDDLDSLLARLDALDLPPDRMDDLDSLLARLDALNLDDPDGPDGPPNRASVLDDPWEIFPDEALDAKRERPVEPKTELPARGGQQLEMFDTVPDQKQVQGDFISQPQESSRTGPPRRAALINDDGTDASVGRIPDSKRKVYTRSQDQLGPKPKPLSPIEQAMALNIAANETQRFLPLSKQSLDTMFNVGKGQALPGKVKELDLVGKNLADPAEADAVRFALTDYVRKNKVSNKVKDNIDTFLKRVTQLSDETQEVTDPVTGISRRQDTINTREYELAQPTDLSQTPDKMFELDGRGRAVPTKAAIDAAGTKAKGAESDTQSKSRATGTGSKAGSRKSGTGKATGTGRGRAKAAQESGGDGVAASGSDVSDAADGTRTSSDTLNKGKKKVDPEADPEVATEAADAATLTPAQRARAEKEKRKQAAEAAKAEQQTRERQQQQAATAARKAELDAKRQAKEDAKKQENLAKADALIADEAGKEDAKGKRKQANEKARDRQETENNIAAIEPGYVKSAVTNKKIRLAKQKADSGKEVKAKEALKQYYFNYNYNEAEAIRAIAYDSETGAQTAQATNEEGNRAIKGKVIGTTSDRAKLAANYVRRYGTDNQKQMLKDAIDSDEVQKAKKLARGDESDTDRVVAERKAAAEAEAAEIERRKKAAEQKKKRKKLAGGDTTLGDTAKGAKVDRMVRQQQAAEAFARDPFSAVADLGYEEGSDTTGMSPGDLALYDSVDLLVKAGTIRLLDRVEGDALTKLQDGDLVGALQELGKLGGYRGRIAKIFAKLAKDTKVEFVSDLGTGPNGETRAGRYIPRTNTVQLSTDLPITLHTLLHEVAHAVTDKALSNKNSAIYKKVNELYQQAKQRFDGNYSVDSIAEFVADYFGNSEFRMELSFMVDKQNKSGLRRFFDAIYKFLFGNRPLNKELRNTMEAMLAPSMASATDSTYDLLVSKNLNAEIKKKFKRRAPSSMKDGINILKTKGAAVLGGLQLSLVVDVAKKYYKSADPMQRAIEKYNSTVFERQQTINNGSLRTFEQWAKDNDQEYMVLENLLYDGTIAEVDLRKTENDHPVDRRADYRKLREIYDNQLSAAGRQEYKRIRSNLDRQYNDLMEQLRIALGTLDPQTGEKVYRKLAAMIDKKALTGYFPLTRSGDFILKYSFTNQQGKQEDAVEFFETRQDRAERIEFLKDGFLTPEQINLISMPTRLDSLKAGNDAVPYGFLNQVLNIVNEAKLDSDIKEELLRAAIEVAPQRSLLRSLQRRKGTLGYERNAIKAYRGTMTNLSRKIASLEMRDELNQIRAELEVEMKQYKAKPNDPEMEYILAVGKELDQRIELAIRPPTGGATDISNWAKTFGYIWTLGLNASSAMIDFAAVPMVIAPHIAARHNISLPEAMGELSSALKLVMSTPSSIKLSSFNEEVVRVETYTTKGLTDAELKELGLERDFRTEKAMPSLKNVNFDDPNLPQELKSLKTLHEVMEARGQYHQFAYDSPNLDMVGESSILSKLNGVSGFHMQVSERIRREATIIADYKMGLKRGLSKKDAAEQAVNTSKILNGAMSVVEGSQFGQKPLLSMGYMYKSYGARMMYLQFKLFRDAFLRSDATPEEKRAAKQNLFNMYMMALAFTGTKGLPMMGIFALFWNTFIADEGEDDFETMQRRFFGNSIIVDGLVDNLTGMNISERVKLTDLLYRSDPNYDQPASDLLINTAFGPVAGSAFRVGRGFGNILDGNVVKGLEGILPPALSNPIRAGRYGLQGDVTKYGNVISDDFGPMSLMGQTLGFSPYDLVKKKKGIAYIKRVESELQDQKSTLLREAYLEYRNLGSVSSDTMQAIDDFNASDAVLSNPKFRITTSGKNNSLDRSFAARKSAMARQIGIGVTTRDPDLARLMLREMDAE